MTEADTMELPAEDAEEEKAPSADAMPMGTPSHVGEDNADASTGKEAASSASTTEQEERQVAFDREEGDCN